VGRIFTNANSDATKKALARTTTAVMRRATVGCMGPEDRTASGPNLSA